MTNDIEAGPAFETETSEQRRIRIRRMKQILRRLPRRATLHRWPILRLFAKTARNQPHLWSFRPREVSLAFYLGSIIAFLPIIGFQFIIAFFVALVARANLPVMMSLQLITNPATAAFVYLATGKLGKTLIDLWGLKSTQWQVGKVAYELAIGGIFVGLLVGLIADLIYRLAFDETQRRRAGVPRKAKF